MAEQRMSLEEAGKLLGGLHPNTVRSRARNGKIPFEKDNSGKWWVFIDPEAAANDAKAKPTKALTNEYTLEAANVGIFKTLEVTIQTLNQELETTRAERDALRSQASEAARRLGELAAAEARTKWLEAEAADLRRRLDAEAEERRKLTALLTHRAEPPAPAPAPEMPVAAAPVVRGRGLLARLWGRGANDQKPL